MKKIVLCLGATLAAAAGVAAAVCFWRHSR